MQLQQPGLLRRCQLNQVRAAIVLARVEQGLAFGIEAQKLGTLQGFMGRMELCFGLGKMNGLLGQFCKRWQQGAFFLARSFELGHGVLHTMHCLSCPQPVWTCLWVNVGKTPQFLARRGFASDA